MRKETCSYVYVYTTLQIQQSPLWQNVFVINIMFTDTVTVHKKHHKKTRNKSLKTWEDIFTANVRQQGKPNVTHEMYNEIQQSEMDPVF